MANAPDVVILSGGFGTRLRGVIAEIPKPMAPVGGRPFLELLLRQLKRNGFSRIVLSVGYKEEIVREHFGDGAFGLRLAYSVEQSPLGTGGALQQASSSIKTETVLVMNGDSYTGADLARLAREHAGSDADATIVVIEHSRKDAGSVVLDEYGKVTAFAEKKVIAEARYLSAGIYMLKTNLVNTSAAPVKTSLEEELLPRWLASGKSIAGFVFDGPCIDIGTPERFQEAQSALEQVERDEILESEELS
jgi:D-glycero-alpha-D-manno-heptose 1-phosphate guanylyltransferase